MILKTQQAFQQRFVFSIRNTVNKIIMHSKLAKTRPMQPGPTIDNKEDIGVYMNTMTWLQLQKQFMLEHNLQQQALFSSIQYVVNNYILYHAKSFFFRGCCAFTGFHIHFVSKIYIYIYLYDIYQLKGAELKRKVTEKRNLDINW